MARPKSTAKAGPKSPAKKNATPADAGSIWICLLLAGAVGLVFYPSLQNGFVNFDDPLYVTANWPVQNGLTWESIRWSFTTLEGGFWQPPVWLSYQLDCQLFGLNPAGHHLTGLLLHAANTILLFLVLQRLTGAKWRSAAVAALFALHPLHVETVAWVADRKDSLAAFFWLGALLAYARYSEKPKEAARRLKYYFLTLGLFTCGLMSKATVATLPLIFLLIDWWPLARWKWDRQHLQWTILRPLILEKIPFLAVALAISLIGVAGQAAIGAVPDMNQFPMADRVQNAVLSYGYYLSQTFWPVNLAGYYPYPRTFSLALVAVFALAGLAFTIIVLRAGRERPYLTVGWIWYVLTLLPAIGLIQIGGHSRADRYTYVPLIGIFLLLVWGLHDLSRHWRQRAFILSALAALALVACGALARRQTGYWHDPEIFSAHILNVTKDNAMAESLLGETLGKQGRYDEATAHLEKALQISPHFPAAENILGAILGKQGRYDEAILHLQTAIKLRPGEADPHGNLADALFITGRGDEASKEYQTALKLKPEDPDTHIKLARLLSSTGQFSDAIVHFREAIRLAPNLSEARTGLGTALLKLEHFDEAISQLQMAVQLDSNSAEAHCYLGVSFCQSGRADEGIAQLQEAVRLNPDYADAKANLEIARRLKAGAPSPAESRR
ncbi:MAG TPA: tetratricopeptide repeat protein [Verrucomicrobiae bacterium]|nr:tetratricopeptide repeat protein [Verrucomicrobiae bacterium]